MKTHQDAGIVLIGSPGYGAVASVTKVCEFIRQVEWYQVKDGFNVYLRDRQKGTDAILRQHRYQKVTTEAAAKALANQWKTELIAELAKREDVARQQEQFAQPPPLVSTQGTADGRDLRDMQKAQLRVLRSKWPQTFAAMDNKASRETIAEAYMLDTAALTGRVCPPSGARSSDPKMAMQIANALHSFSRRKQWRDSTLIDCLLAFNWTRLVYLNAQETADVLNRMLADKGIKVTPGQIKQRRLRLDLTSRRQPGPTRKA